MSGWSRVALVALPLLALLTVRSCLFSGDAREPAVVTRVKGELAIGRREYLIRQREQTADLLRDLRALYGRLMKKGETARARKVEAAIREQEDHHRRLDAAVGRP